MNTSDFKVASDILLEILLIENNQKMQNQNVTRQKKTKSCSLRRAFWETIILEMTIEELQYWLCCCHLSQSFVSEQKKPHYVVNLRIYKA